MRENRMWKKIRKPKAISKKAPQEYQSRRRARRDPGPRFVTRLQIFPARFIRNMVAYIHAAPPVAPNRKTKPQMNTVQPSRNPKNPPRRREERKVFEIAFLRAFRVFAVKISLTAGQDLHVSSTGVLVA